MRIYATSGQNWDVYITRAIESNISQFRAILRRFRALFNNCFFVFFPECSESPEKTLNLCDTGHIKQVF